MCLWTETCDDQTGHWIVNLNIDKYIVKTLLADDFYVLEEILVPGCSHHCIDSEAYWHAKEMHNSVYIQEIPTSIWIG